MNDSDRAAVRNDALGHAEGVFADVERRWGSAARLGPLPVTPLSDDNDSFPASVDEFHDRLYPYAAGATVVDTNGQLLCVYSPTRGEWETPGGAGEPDETPAETARRETLEETGIECEITDVLFVQSMELALDALVETNWWEMKSNNTTKLRTSRGSSLMNYRPNCETTSKNTLTSFRWLML